jgi:quercetin dioxygenase-like cupin family protein
MKFLVIAPVTVGFGVGLAVLWAMTTDAGRRWRNKVRDRVASITARPGFRAIKSSDMDWTRNQQHRDLVTYFMKPLFQNTRTGDSIMLVRYPAGEMNPSHTHPVGHGMYVLQGTLVTHRGTFGRDTFVWFPANEVMFHGAGPDEDLIVVFTTNVDSRIEYVRDKN